MDCDYSKEEIKREDYTFQCQLHEKPSSISVCPGLGLYSLVETLPEVVMHDEIPDTTRVKTLYDNLVDVLLVGDPCAKSVWVDADQHWLAWHSDSLE